MWRLALPPGRRQGPVGIFPGFCTGRFRYHGGALRDRQRTGRPGRYRQAARAGLRGSDRSTCLPAGRGGSGMGTMPAYIPGIQGCPGPTGYGDDDGALHGRPRLIRGLVRSLGAMTPSVPRQRSRRPWTILLRIARPVTASPVGRRRAVSTCHPAGACTAAPGARGAAPLQPSAMGCDADPNAAGQRLQVNSSKRPGRADTAKFRETPG